VVGAVCCFAQGGTIDNLLTASGGTGLFERFLFNAEPHLLGKRNMLKDSAVCPATQDAYNNKITEWTQGILSNNQPDYDQLPTLKLSKQGYDLLALCRHEIEPFMADGARYSHDILRGAAGKIDAQVLSIAANLFLIDHDPKQEAKEVPLEYVAAAIEIAKHQIESLLEACKNKGIIDLSAEFSAVINYLERKPHGATMNEIKNSLKTTNPFKTMLKGRAQAIDLTIKKMIEAGALTSETLRTGKTGQEVTKYKNA
jgi:hypothetical protein